MINKLIDKLLTNNSLFFILYFFITIIVLSFIVVSIHTGIPIETFTMDPLTVANLKPYTGFLSNLGVIAWSFAAGICFFSCLIVRKRNADRQLFFFLFFSSVLSAILLVDDLYLFHERISPALLKISEKGIFAIYGVLTLTYLIYFRKLILQKTNFYLLALSLMLFGASAIVDIFNLFNNEWHHAYEDIPKLFGVFTWLAYHFSSCQRALTS